MKKSNLLKTLLVSSLVVVGCSNHDSSNDSNSTTDSTTSIDSTSQTTNTSSTTDSSSTIDSTTPSDSISVTEKTKLSNPTNLLVLKTDDETNKLVVTFDVVENATSYKIAIYNGDQVIMDYQDIVSNGTIDAFKDEGNYIIKVIACGDEETFTNSDPAEFNYTIERWVDKVDENGGKWNILVEQGKPVGKGTFTYANNTVYSGYFNDDFTRKEGRLTYENNMYYEGKFVNDNFNDDNGVFSWSTTGNIEDGNSYRGKFVNGSPDGQYGTYTFQSYYNNGTGIQYWEGIMEGFCYPKANETGKGKINFGGQYYEGDVFVTENKEFQRVGNGANVWTNAENCGWFVNYTNTTSEILQTKQFDRYIGGFDTINHGWFYGKGIMYIKNEDGTPYGYVVGNWDWKEGTLTKDESFTEDDLLEEYRAEGVLNLTKALPGEINYDNGAKFVGTINNDNTRCEGRLTYENNMYYEGKFVNDNFNDDNGVFSWSTTGNIEDGNSYRGKFVNGSPDGQYGTYTFPSYYNNGTGIQYWEGIMEGFCYPKANETGKGKINFGGQYYEGDVFVTENKEFQRVGNGANVWTNAENCGWFVNYTNTTSEILQTKQFDRYIGGFDTINHGWFYGKGIMYIKNEDGTPYGYVVGNWDWKEGTLTKDESFTEDDLLEEYRVEGVLNLTKVF